MKELTPIEERWARGWVRGIARILASGPPTEKPEEFKKELEAIEKVALEPGALVYEKAKKWRRRMIEVFAPSPSTY